MKCDAPLAEQASQAVDHLRQSTPTISEVVLALATPHCLTGRVATTGLPRTLSATKREQALLFRLEEQLPLPAEEVTAAFCSAGSQAFGVATITATVQQAVEAVEACGLRVDHVCPLTLLIAQGLVTPTTTTPLSKRIDAVLIPDGHGWSWVAYQNNQPVQWHHLGDLAHDVPPRVTAHPQASSEANQAPFTLAILSPHASATLADAPTLPANIQRVALDRETSTTALAQAASILASRSEPWINLRTGPLAAADPLRQVRGPLNAVLALAACLLLLLAGAGWWHGSQLAKQADQAQLDQNTAYQQAMPGRPVPTNVPYRLRNEARALSAVTGQDAGRPRFGSSLRVLHEVTRRLPRDLRYRVTDIRIDQQQLVIQGESRTHPEADLIAASLRRQHGPDIQPPRTERLQSQAVAFTLVAPLEEGRVPPPPQPIAQRQEGAQP